MSLFKKKAKQISVEPENFKTENKRSVLIKKIIKWSVVIAVIVVIVTVGVKGIKGFQLRTMASTKRVTTTQKVKVEVRDIERVLSSSGTVKPLNTYEVRTLVEGEIISADFEEGDQVEKGDVLYTIATDDIDSKIESAQTSVTRAREEYNKAVENYEEAAEEYKEAMKDYNEAKEKVGSPEIISETAGTITAVHVEEGNTIQEGAPIADIYDNSYMLLEVPFLSSEVSSDLVGKAAEVELTDNFEVLEGEVYKVSSLEKILAGNRIVKTVTIKVPNPGGLTEDKTATAAIGEISSSDEGTFKPLVNSVIYADKSGEIEKLNIEEGKKVKAGDVLIRLNEDYVEKSLETYKKNLENAETGMENAEDQVEKAKESLEDAERALQDLMDTKKEDYNITAPISGRVIRKDALAGDTITSNSTLCVIYDLSALTFEMYIDELDVLSVKEGQEVNVTADALEGVELKGVVTNVSLESTYSSGVTQYPVTVRIDEPGDLLPGMNVTGEIILEKAEGVLAVPAEALMCGDVVYVADESVTEANGDIPAGYRAAEVETGLSDGDYIEIKSGLSEGDEVLVIRSSGETTENFMMPGGFGGEMPSMNMQNRPGFGNERSYGGRSGGGPVGQR